MTQSGSQQSSVTARAIALCSASDPWVGVGIEFTPARAAASCSTYEAPDLIDRRGAARHVPGAHRIGVAELSKRSGNHARYLDGLPDDLTQLGLPVLSFLRNEYWR